VISVVSHFVGRQISDMICRQLDGRLESAAEIHRRLLPLVDALFCVTNPIPVKYALNRIGFDVGPFRLPLCEPDATTGERIMAESAATHRPLAWGCACLDTIP
jgi:4-hydroxy-tetrahydrodipicolinate synthase